MTVSQLIHYSYGIAMFSGLTVLGICGAGVLFDLPDGPILTRTLACFGSLVLIAGLIIVAAVTL